jgi:hypothetical protein
MCICYAPSRTFKVQEINVRYLARADSSAGQNIYFCLNHPVRFVRVVGVVVAIDDITSKYSAITLDDGSGATIELKIVRILLGDRDSKNPLSGTTVSNLNVISQFGVFEITVDHERIEIGTVLKAKGTISEFRGVKQLDLKRIHIVASTDEEAQAWAETAAFKINTLSAPWRITSSQHSEIKSKIKAEKKRTKDYDRSVREYKTKKAEHEAARAAHLVRKEAKRETRRRREEAMMNSGALI